MMILKLLNMIQSMTVKAEPEDHNDSEDILTFLRGLRHTAARSGRIHGYRVVKLRSLCHIETT